MEEPKTRVIDDCRRSGLNDAFTTNCKLQLHDIDSLACVLALIAQSLEEGECSVELSTGDLIGGPVVSAVSKADWVGRTLDLSKAYKQTPIHPESRRFCIIGFASKGSWHYFETDALPFGVVASVYDFNRIARSLHFILCSYLQASPKP